MEIILMWLLISHYCPDWSVITILRGVGYVTTEGYMMSQGKQLKKQNLILVSISSYIVHTPLDRWEQFHYLRWLMLLEIL